MLKNLRYLFSVLLLAVFSVSAYAGKITFSEEGFDNAAQIGETVFTGEGFTISFTDGSTATAYYNTGSAIRVYGGGSMKVTATSGKITNIEITFSGSNKPSANDEVVTVGTYDATSGVWTGEETEVVFARPSGSGHWRIQAVDVTVSTGSVLPTADLSFATTSFTLEDSEISTFVVPELSYDTNYDGTITYSSDNEDVAIVDASTGAVTLTGELGTAHITASAGATQSYRASTASYTITVTGYTNRTIADLAGATEAANDIRLVLTDALVTYVSGNYIFVREGDKAIMFYQTGLALEAGQVLNGNIKMNLVMYNGTPEMKKINGVTNLDDVTITEGTVEPRVATLADVISLDVLNDYIVVSGLTISVDGNTTKASDGTNEVTLYNRFGIEMPEFENDATYTVEGIGALFGTTNQIFYISFTKDVQPVQITAAKVATLYNADKALEVPTGVVAYTAKIDEVTGEVIPSVTFNAGDVIPAGEAVILEGAEGNYDFQIVANPSTELDDANVLHGETENGFTSYGAATMSWWYYLLADGPKGIAFYWGADNGAAFPCKEGNAYIALPAGSNAKVLLFGGEATGIKTIDKANVENGAVYNLNGQRVNPTQRGIYIVNGKKVIVK